MQNYTPAKLSMAFALDVVFAIALFNGFAKWQEVSGLVNHGLALLIYLIIVVDWLSLRATSEVYTVRILILDLVDLFIFANIFDKLKKPFSPWLSYQPVFWLYLAGLSFVYMIWNFSLAGKLTWPNMQALRRWGFSSLITLILACLTYFILVKINQINTSDLDLRLLSNLAILPIVLVWIILLMIWTITVVRKIK